MSELRMAHACGGHDGGGSSQGSVGPVFFSSVKCQIQEFREGLISTIQPPFLSSKKEIIWKSYIGLEHSIVWYRLDIDGMYCIVCSKVQYSLDLD